MKILVLDTVTETVSTFNTVADAFRQAEYLISLGHNVVLTQGGKS